MKCKIKISAGIIKSYPVACLFFKEKNKSLKFSVSSGIIAEYKKYIISNVAGENYFFQLPIAGQVILVTVIEISENEKDYRIAEKTRLAGSRLFKEIKKLHLQKILLTLPDHAEYLIKYAEGLILSAYSFGKYKTSKKSFSLDEIMLAGEKIDAAAVENLRLVSEGVYIARDLVNEPGSFLTAVQLGREIELLGEKSGFFTEVFNKNKIKSLRFGGLLAVNKGSHEPPTFSVLEWKPENAINKSPVILIGKGITFDTGGLSLKPTLDSMDRMKSDMAGAAVVAAVFCIVSKLKIPVYLMGLIPATDNRPGENSCLPGDIISISDGTTVEVLNTDAEGRLILADALSYAKKFDPSLVIDLATLTGAASTSVGKYGIVAFEKNAKKYLKILKQSGRDTYERLVKFPLWDEYKELLDSEIADIKNVGGRDAGAITAAKFLERFTGYPWIHLDIAPLSFNKGSYGYITSGGSGSGVRLIADFLIKNFVIT